MPSVSRRASSPSGRSTWRAVLVRRRGCRTGRGRPGAPRGRAGSLPRHAARARAGAGGACATAATGRARQERAADRSRGATSSPSMEDAFGAATAASWRRVCGRAVPGDRSKNGRDCAQKRVASTEASKRRGAVSGRSGHRERRFGEQLAARVGALADSSRAACRPRASSPRAARSGMRARRNEFGTYTATPPALATSIGAPLVGTKVTIRSPYTERLPLRSISNAIDAGSVPAGSNASCVSATVAPVSPWRTMTGIDAPTSAVRMTPMLPPCRAQPRCCRCRPGRATRSICRCERYSPAARFSGLRSSMRTVCELPGAIVTWRGEKRSISSANCSPGCGRVGGRELAGLAHAPVDEADAVGLRRLALVDELDLGRALVLVEHDPGREEHQVGPGRGRRDQQRGGGDPEARAAAGEGRRGASACVRGCNVRHGRRIAASVVHGDAEGSGRSCRRAVRLPTVSVAPTRIV